MTPNELKSAIDTLWNGNQSQAARELGLSSSRRMREYISGDRTIPQGLIDDVTSMLELFPSGKKSVNPGVVARSLHAMMVKNGWESHLAAAGILGAAVSVAEAAGCDVWQILGDARNERA